MNSDNTKEDLVKLLIGLNYTAKIKAAKFIISKFDQSLAIDSQLYKDSLKTDSIVSSLYDSVDTSDKFLEALIKLEGFSPYSIFHFVLNRDYADILIHGNGYTLAGGLGDENPDIKIRIPDKHLELYRFFLKHLSHNIMLIAGRKFDRGKGNAIIDVEFGSIRFNMSHGSLNSANNSPILAIRKQMVNKSFEVDDMYISSICSSQNQIDSINSVSEKGTFIVCGEVGSGKTTLLKYMGNYKIEDKVNMAIIEDTVELGIDVPISYLTNNNYSIKDLFTLTLRQKPTSIMIGEVRTDEIIDVLEAALTISVGTSIHANSFIRAIQRIIFMSMDRKIDPEHIRDLISASVDCFIFMENRKVKEVWKKKPEHINNIYEAYELVI